MTKPATATMPLLLGVIVALLVSGCGQETMMQPDGFSDLELPAQHIDLNVGAGDPLHHDALGRLIYHGSPDGEGRAYFELYGDSRRYIVVMQGEVGDRFVVGWVPVEVRAITAEHLTLRIWEPLDTEPARQVIPLSGQARLAGSTEVSVSAGRIEHGHQLSLRSRASGSATATPAVLGATLEVDSVAVRIVEVGPRWVRIEPIGHPG